LGQRDEAGQHVVQAVLLGLVRMIADELLDGLARLTVFAGRFEAVDANDQFVH